MLLISIYSPVDMFAKAIEVILRMSVRDPKLVIGIQQLSLNKRRALASVFYKHVRLSLSVPISKLGIESHESIMIPSQQSL